MHPFTDQNLSLKFNRVTVLFSKFFVNVNYKQLFGEKHLTQSYLTKGVKGEIL